MNRKIMILMVAVVATVLPAVAVADVMITGSVGGLGVAAPDAFTVQPGSNYIAANASAGFGWHANVHSESEVLGNITLGVMTNETIFEVNVLDINFSSSGTFNLTVSVPTLLSGSGAFPADSVLYVSNQSFVMGSASHPISSSHSADVNSVSLSTAGTTSFTYTVTSSTTLYFAIEVGAGPQSGSFSIAGTFTS